MYYRKEIDGLRALAVVPVILFHAGFTLFSGGFVGVDIFFVISGYLITSIILKEKLAGTFSLLNFYERRARRILPALLFIVLCCLPVAWILMIPHELKDFSQSLAAVSTFTSNIFFFFESGYFEAPTETKPLLHTWSLAVEEQFYIFFPLLFLICWSVGKRYTLFAASLVFAVLSFFLAQWMSSHNPSANFYLAPMRAWELLIGVLCAVYLTSSKAKAALHGNGVIAFLGLLMILISIFVFDKHTPHPSFYTFLPVLGTALIIVFAHGDNVVTRSLSWKVFVGIGLISYSAYLWHVPLLAFMRIWTLNNLQEYQVYILIVLSFVFSWFTWKFIETPFRKKTQNTSKQFLAAVGVISFCLLLLGIVGHSTNGFHELKVAQLPEHLRTVIIDREKEVLRRQKLWKNYLKVSSRGFEESKSVPRVLVLGDSKSEDLYVAVEVNEQVAKEVDIRRVRFLDSCYKTYLKSVSEHPESSFENKDCIASVKKLDNTNLLESAEIIVLSNTWDYTSYNETVEFADYLVSKGKKVLIISTGNFNDVSSLSMALAKQAISPADAGNYFYNNRRLDTKSVSDTIENMVKNKPNIRFLSKYDIFCDDSLEKCNLYGADGKPYVYDSGHVTLEGARYFGKRIQELSWLP